MVVRLKELSVSESEDKKYKSLKALVSNELPDVSLQQLHMPSSRSQAHKHAVIAISGFLSESADQDSDWLHLKALCVKHDVPLFAVKWKSNSATAVGSIVMEGLQKLKINPTSVIAGGLKGGVQGMAMGLLKSVVSKDNLVTAVQTVSATKDAFLVARDNAKITGKILAHYFALAPEFQTYSLSLIGFSLGTQVIKSCINGMPKMGVEGKTQIQNVYLLGGAAYVRQTKAENQMKVFSSIVNGRICNVYTENDTTLKSF